MKTREIRFDPLTVLYNVIEDAELRARRRTIWGDLSPGKVTGAPAVAEGIPYTYALFIQSRDGKTTDDFKGDVGRMAGVPADRFGQYELRAHVDAFLIGAATLRADRAVGAPAEPELMERRLQDRGNAAPLNVFFSASGNIPADSPVFQEPDLQTAIFVTPAASDRVAELKKITSDVVVVGSDSPLTDTWRELWRRGVRTIGFEGGPTLMGLALKERLVHELLLTHSPLIVGGQGPSFAAIDAPLLGITTQPLFLGLDPSSDLLFERSLIAYE